MSDILVPFPDWRNLYSCVLSLSLSSTFLLGFLLLSFFAFVLLYSPYSSLYPFVHLRVFVYYYYYYYYCYHHHHHYHFILRFFFSVFSIFQIFVCLFCLFLYFFLSLLFFLFYSFYSTLFIYLVLILGFNYCNFFLLFIFAINLCYLFPLAFTVFFTKCELLSFFTFQHMLYNVIWFFI